VKRPLGTRQLLLIGLPVAGLLLGLAGYLALVSPQKSKAARLSAAIGQVQTALYAAHAPRTKPVPVQAADIFRLVKAMPDTPDMPSLLVDLSRLARESGVNLQSVKPSALTPLVQGYAVLPVTVTVAGTFASVNAFLARMRAQVTAGRRLHVSGRLLLANELSLSSSGKTLTATLSLDAYVYGIGAPPPAPPTTTGATTTTPQGGST
jgi:Tfp pilus assembly protein PilO